MLKHEFSKQLSELSNTNYCVIENFVEAFERALKYIDTSVNVSDAYPLRQALGDMLFYVKEGATEYKSLDDENDALRDERDEAISDKAPLSTTATKLSTQLSESSTKLTTTITKPPRKLKNL